MTDSAATARPPRRVRVAIIGSGFGGVAVAAALRRAGDADVVLLERADRIGGVWRDNTYPGCACDIPAPLYSYSFALNPDWSRRFPPHSEILDYLHRCVAELGLADSVRLRTEVTDASWDEAGACWRLRTADGAELTADVLIPAVGQLSRPVVPALPGAQRFAGRAMHTARWDPAVRLDGARVAVIGTGASAVQLVPAIADRAARVTVFQRTPPWTLPKPDRRHGRLGQGALPAGAGADAGAPAGVLVGHRAHRAGGDRQPGRRGGAAGCLAGAAVVAGTRPGAARPRHACRADGLQAGVVHQRLAAGPGPRRRRAGHRGDHRGD